MKHKLCPGLAKNQPKMDFLRLNFPRPQIHPLCLQRTDLTHLLLLRVMECYPKISDRLKDLKGWHNMQKGNFQSRVVDKCYRLKHQVQKAHFHVRLLLQQKVNASRLQ